MNQTKYKTSAMIRRYTRLDNVQQHNAAKELGLLFLSLIYIK